MLFLLAVVFIFAEAAFRMGFFRPLFYQPGHRYGIGLMLDRKVLFKLKPASRPDINNMGYRDMDFTKDKQGKKRALFLGDSFVIGLNVKPHETMPKALERLSGWEVYNMGVYAYGPDQSLVQLWNEGLGLNPDIVILCIYPANDLNDVYKNKLLIPGKNGKVEYNSENISARLMGKSDTLYLIKYALNRYGQSPAMREEFSGLFYELFEDVNDWDFMKDPDSAASREKVALTRSVLREMKNTLAKRNIGFIAVIMPAYDNMVNDSSLKENGVPKERYFALEDAVKGILEAEAVDFIDLRPYFAEMSKGKYAVYDPEDRHLSAFGNEYTASIIGGYAKAKGIR